MLASDFKQIFEPISLSEMDAVKLMNRVDTKYVLNRDLLPAILEEIQNNYFILEIGNERIFQYNSLYYDTDKDYMYLAHHNGKLNRYKIRFRKYVASELCFLEIKYKFKGNRTIKHRTKIEEMETALSERSIAFIDKYTPFNNKKLTPKIYTNFSRMTLVSKELTERVTIDLDLSFRYNGYTKQLDNTVIVELKRDGSASKSHLIDAFGHFRIFPQGFSKYCIGRALVEENLKRNNFKERLLKINKINNGDITYHSFGQC
jgi:hypothetical protein